MLRSVRNKSGALYSKQLYKICAESLTAVFGAQDGSGLHAVEIQSSSAKFIPVEYYPFFICAPELVDPSSYSFV